MDTVDIRGETYIKATRLAKDFGYTKDYVGQLCRGKKIPATLVGRTWYVKSGALDAHKKSKSRKNKAKTLKVFESTKKDVAVGMRKISREAYVPGITPEYRKRLLETEIRYSKDETELIPVLRRGNVEIKYAEEKEASMRKARPLTQLVTKDTKKDEPEQEQRQSPESTQTSTILNGRLLIHDSGDPTEVIDIARIKGRVQRPKGREGDVNLNRSKGKEFSTAIFTLGILNAVVLLTLVSSVLIERTWMYTHEVSIDSTKVRIDSTYNVAPTKIVLAKLIENHPFK